MFELRREPVAFHNAYYSDPLVRFVHVAAPGVDPIAGWITDDAIGQASGTSQAAAYVAGIVASMIGYFPNSYTSPDVVKIKLQATSRPLPLRFDGTPIPMPKKLRQGSSIQFWRNWTRASTGLSRTARGNRSRSQDGRRRT